MTLLQFSLIATLYVLSVLVTSYFVGKKSIPEAQVFNEPIMILITIGVWVWPVSLLTFWLYKGMAVTHHFMYSGYTAAWKKRNSPTKANGDHQSR